ncbi:uncharacterized protein [Linepithema humile]|uniref:uncharacterized protein n=1 Tax=Linepithema humile TaxID=83485 RepID=UPI00351F08B2
MSDTDELIEQENEELVQVFTCGLCETICDDIPSHPCLNGFKSYFLNENSFYFYPQCDDGTILARSAVGGKQLVVNTEVSNSKLVSKSNCSSSDETFISAIEIREPLWNIKLPVAQRSKEIKSVLWEEVCKVMKGKYTVESAKKKWKNLCDTHRRYVKEEKNIRSGSATKKKNKWMYYEQMGFMRDIELVEKNTVSNININDSYEDEHDENEAPKGQASKRKKSKTKEEAIDRLADALSTPQPAIQFPAPPIFPPPIFPPPPPPMDAVDAFLTMIGHELRSLNDSMRSDVMLNIHTYIHEEKKKHTH